jgi:hypothetical protein
MNIAGKDIHALFDETIQKLRQEIENSKLDHEARVQDLIERFTAEFQTVLESSPKISSSGLLRDAVELHVVDAIYHGYDSATPAIRLLIENFCVEISRGGPLPYALKRDRKYRFVVAVVPIKEA